MTDKKQAALKRALDWIEGNSKYDAAKRIAQTIREALAEQPAQDKEPCGWRKKYNGEWAYSFTEDAWDFIRRVPPAQPQQEPVAWMIWTHGPVNVFMNKDEANMEFDRLNHAYPEPARMLVPLYTSPPTNANAGKPWVGLEPQDFFGVIKSDAFEAGAYWANNKLREKNT